MQAPQSMVEELMNEDKEIRILTYKLLVEKFNKKYQSLSERQKGILKEYVASISDSANLRKFLNEKLKEIKQELIEQTEKVKDKVTKIKTQEVIKFIKPLKEGIAIKDETITGLLQYYELIDELKRVSK
jgi:vacuolar-type H+-ATPase subunit C/Vma6